MNKQHTPLLPGEFYHLFNRAVGSEKLFHCEENYRYFLAKMQHHISPAVDLFAYSLLPNHFHLFVRVKPEAVIQNLFEVKKKKPFHVKQHDLPDFVMEQFSNWLNGFTKAFNKMYHRKGGLFMDYLKRTEAGTDADIPSFIFYVHKNAVHHGLTKKIGDWQFDSYQLILSELPNPLMRAEVINWFGSKSLFINFHDQPVDLKNKDLDLDL